MKREEAYSMFKEMIDIASVEIAKFTRKQKLSVDYKQDKTIVTECDKKISEVLKKYVGETLPFISEEDEESYALAGGGNYIIIDPIDGNLGYIEHVKKLAEKKSNKPSTDLNPSPVDHCLLIGIVENGIPRFGCCYNYVSGETFFLDSTSKSHTIRKKIQKKENVKFAYYVDNRGGSDFDKK